MSSMDAKRLEQAAAGKRKLEEFRLKKQARASTPGRGRPGGPQPTSQADDGSTISVATAHAERADHPQAEALSTNTFDGLLISTHTTSQLLVERPADSDAEHAEQPQAAEALTSVLAEALAGQPTLSTRLLETQVGSAEHGNPLQGEGQSALEAEPVATAQPSAAPQALETSQLQDGGLHTAASIVASQDAEPTVSLQNGSMALDEDFASSPDHDWQMQNTRSNSLGSESNNIMHSVGIDVSLGSTLEAASARKVPVVAADLLWDAANRDVIRERNVLILELESAKADIANLSIVVATLTEDKELLGHRVASIATDAAEAARRDHEVAAQLQQQLLELNEQVAKTQLTIADKEAELQLAKEAQYRSLQLEEQMQHLSDMAQQLQAQLALSQQERLEAVSELQRATEDDRKLLAQVRHFSDLSQELQVQLDAAQQEHARASTGVQELTAQLASSQQAVTELEAKVSELQGTKDVESKLLEEFKQLSDLSQQLQAQLDVALQERSHASTEVEQLHKQLAASKQAFAELEAKVSGLQGAQEHESKLQEQVKQLSDLSRQLQAQRDAAQQELSQSSTEVEQLAEQLAASKQALIAAEAEVSELQLAQEGQSQLLGQVQHLSISSQQLQAQLAEAQQQRLQMSTEVEQLSQELAASKQALAAAEAQATELRGMHDADNKALEKVQQLQAQLQASQQEQLRKVNEVEQMSEQLVTLKQALTDLEAKAAQAEQKARAESGSAVARVEKQLQDERSSRAHLEERAKKALADRRASETRLKKRVSELESIKTESDALSAQLSAAKQALSASEAKVLELQRAQEVETELLQQVKQLSDLSQQLQIQLDAAQQERSHMSTEVQQLADQLAASQQALAAAEEQVLELQRAQEGQSKLIEQVLELQRLREGQSKLIEQVERLSNLSQQLQAQLDTAQQERTDALMQVQQISQDLDAYKEALEASQAKVSELRDAQEGNHKLLEQVEQYRDLSQQIQAQLDAALQEHSKTTSEVEHLTEQLVVTKHALTELELKAAHAEQKAREESAKSVARLEKQLQDERSSRAHLEERAKKALADRRASENRLKKRVIELEATKADSDALSTQLNAAIEALASAEAKVSDLQHAQEGQGELLLQVRSLSDLSQQLQAKLDAVQQEHSQTSTEVEQLTRRLYASQQALAAAEAKASELQRLQDVHKKALEDVDQLQVQLRQSQQEQLRTSGEVERLVEQLVAVKEAFLNSEEKVHAQQKAQEKHASMTARLEKELQDERTLRTDLAERFKVTKDEGDALQEQLAAANDALAESEAKVLNLQLAQEEQIKLFEQVEQLADLSQRQKAQLDAAQQEGARAFTEVSRLTEQLAASQQALAAAQAQASELQYAEESQHAMVESNKQLQAQLIESQREQLRLSTAVEQLTEQLAAAKEALTYLKAKASQEQTVREASADTLARLEKQLLDERTAKAHLEEQATSLTNQSGALSAQLIAASKALAASEAKVSELQLAQQGQIEYAKEVQRLSIMSQQLQEQLDAAQQALARQVSEAARDRKAVEDSASEAVVHRDQQLARLQQQVLDLSQDIADKLRMLDAQEVELQQANDDQRRLQDEVHLLSDLTKQMQEQLNTMQQERSLAASEVEQLRSVHNEADRRIRGLEDERTDLEARLSAVDELRVQFLQLKQKNLELHDMVGSLHSSKQEQEHRLQLELERKSREYDALAATLDNQLREMESFKASSQLADELSTSLEARTREAEDLRNRCKELQDQAEDLQVRLQEASLLQEKNMPSSAGEEQLQNALQQLRELQEKHEALQRLSQHPVTTAVIPYDASKTEAVEVAFMDAQKAAARELAKKQAEVDALGAEVATEEAEGLYAALIARQSTRPMVSTSKKDEDSRLLPMTAYDVEAGSSIFAEPRQQQFRSLASALRASRVTVLHNVHLLKLAQAIDVVSIQLNSRPFARLLATFYIIVVHALLTVARLA
eukprot:jgi/Chlat1/4661/Chrsp3S00438